MIQGTGDTRFAKKPLAGGGCHEPGFQYFERNEAVQVQIPDFEDFTHRSFADPLDDFEMANFLMDR
jgi:hypothetical protein